jgi:CubicO group peptidase (beta-lactamase class C family)
VAPGGQLRPADLADYLSMRVEGAGVAAYAAAVVCGAAEAIAFGGERRHGSGEAVEARTPFHICSCSKAFTALLFEGLVRDGLADWDAPVCGIVPEFAPADPRIAGRCTFRDLGAMRVGLTREGIAEWGFRPEAPVGMRLDRVGAMSLETPFRDRFSYSNLNYIALALAAARISGASFADSLQARVFDPIGLKTASLQASSDAVSPHMPIGGRIRPVPELTGDNSQGSARVHLSAEDAAVWLRSMLGRCKAAEGVFSCQSLVRPRIEAAGLPTAWAYGFGWSLAELEGRRLYSHGGGGRGWRAMMILDPEQDAAAMVMLAHEGDEAEALALELMALAAGRRPERLTAAVAARADGQRPARPAAVEPQAAAFAGDPAGLYRGPVTGLVRIGSDGSGLRFAAEDAPAFDARLSPVGDGGFGFDFDNPAMTPMPRDPAFAIHFAGDAEGGLIAEAGYFGRLRRVAR